MDNLKLKTTDTKKLVSHRFRRISDTEYVYRFPVHKYKNTTLITCILTADVEDKVVMVEVIDNNNNTLYAPFYNREYGKNKVAEDITAKVESEINMLKKVGVVK